MGVRARACVHAWMYVLRCVLVGCMWCVGVYETTNPLTHSLALFLASFFMAFLLSFFSPSVEVSRARGC